MEQIRIPNDVESMRIKHLPFLMESMKFEDREPTDGEIKRMNAEFTGIPLAKMGRFTKQDNKNLFNNIVDVFGTYSQKKIPLEITYPDKDGNEITYEFLSDFSRLPYDWYVDKDEAEPYFDENPIDLAAFVYIEKGLSYGEPDKHDNVKNPRSVRNEIFKEHMPLSLFLDIQSFFLLNWDVLRKYSMEVKNQRSEKTK